MPAPYLNSIITDLAGPSLTAEEREWLMHPLIGGIILFSRNYQNPQQLRDLVRMIRDIRPELFMTVDQEGGPVQRFREGFTLLPSVSEFGELYQKDPAKACEQAEHWGYIMASELRAFDIDLSFAPVLDIDRGISQVMSRRCFAKDPDTVIALASAYIKGMQAAGMTAIGKHFPGHGAVTADSHLELPTDTRSYEDILATDMRPFVTLLSQLGGIMPAHIRFSAVDTQPASLSSVWLQDILRQTLKFRGLIVSDDLSMGGAAVGGNYTARVQAALSAGCDKVLICNNPIGRTEVLTEFTHALT
ncbi:MAG: beta-N-acetylhexosaminidase [Gammaproteobacteria bacterium]